MVRVNKKKTYKEYKQTIIMSLALLGAFLIGIFSVLGYQYVDKQYRPVFKEASIGGSDGLMGLVGYSRPFADAQAITYAITYYNQSHEDRRIHIKATRFSRDPEKDIRDVNGSLAGKVIDASFSSKKVIRAGEFGIFVMELSQTNPSTEYIELEAFKT